MNWLVWRDDAESESLYNCSFYAVDDIPLENRRHLALGILFLLTATLAEILYIPCIWAMTRRENLRESCYKLMFLLGVLDVLNIVVSGFLTGYFAMVGVVYCSHPDFIYIAGMFGLGLWGAESMASVLLALNRCIAIWNPAAAEQLFYGKRMWLWLSLPILYMLTFFVFSRPPVYSSILVGWFFNPHNSYFDDMESKYGSIMHTVHNSALGPLLFAIYTTFFWILRERRTKIRINNADITRGISASRQRKNLSTFIQVLLIGILHMFACVTYIYMQFFPGKIVALFASYGWLLVQSTTPVIYLAMNSSMRNILKSTIRRVPYVSSNFTSTQDHRGRVTKVGQKSVTVSQNRDNAENHI